MKIYFVPDDCFFDSAGHKANLAAIPSPILFKEAGRQFTELSHRVIGCAMEVHRQLGPGLLESTYERCLVHELLGRGIRAESQCPIPVVYKGLKLDCGYRADLLVEEELLLELKSVECLSPLHEAQLLTYLKLARIRHGFLINFNVPRLKDGLKSFVLDQP
jgi:GxxExxY protein